MTDNAIPAFEDFGPAPWSSWPLSLPGCPWWWGYRRETERDRHREM